MEEGKSEKVVYLKGYLTGQAKCLICGHKWVALVPTTRIWFKCPECGIEKATMVYPVLRDEYLHWRCNCGNDLFYVTPEGIYCPNCGEWQEGWD